MCAEATSCVTSVTPTPLQTAILDLINNTVDVCTEMVDCINNSVPVQTALATLINNTIDVCAEINDCINNDPVVQQSIVDQVMNYFNTVDPL